MQRCVPPFKLAELLPDHACTMISRRRWSRCMEGRGRGRTRPQRLGPSLRHRWQAESLRCQNCVLRCQNCVLAACCGGRRHEGSGDKRHFCCPHSWCRHQQISHTLQVFRREGGALILYALPYGDIVSARQGRIVGQRYTWGRPAGAGWARGHPQRPALDCSSERPTGRSRTAPPRRQPQPCSTCIWLVGMGRALSFSLTDHIWSCSHHTGIKKPHSPVGWKASVL